MRESEHESAAPVKHIYSFYLSFLSSLGDDSTVMVIGKATYLESRNSKIHPQLRCAF